MKPISPPERMSQGSFRRMAAVSRAFPQRRAENRRKRVPMDPRPRAMTLEGRSIPRRKRPMVPKSSTARISSPLARRGSFPMALTPLSFAE